MPPAKTPIDPPLPGIVYALLAYLSWGLMPIYWKLVGQVPALEMVAHRVVWSVLVLAFLIHLLERWSAVIAALRDCKRLLLLVATAALISVNWLTFVWAIQQERVLEASLGYFINPLVNVLLGMLFLGERLRPWQLAAVTLATVGVSYFIARLGIVPWLALTLAASFGSYGLLRKVAPVDGLVGLAVETFLLAPIALAYLVYLESAGSAMFWHSGWRTDLLIAQAGWVTALPLLWFANAARRLRYATVGFFQYLAPTCHFLLAVGLYGETLTTAHWVMFSFIWVALAIYTADSARGFRGPPVSAPPDHSSRP
jgi:chloramphenicol-sensitive protein RarD